MYKSFSCTYFRPPKSEYIQEMGEVIPQPIHNVVGICKHTIMIYYQFTPQLVNLKVIEEIM
jgi:hypothetical protein